MASTVTIRITQSDADQALSRVRVTVTNPDTALDVVEPFTIADKFRGLVTTLDAQLVDRGVARTGGLRRDGATEGLCATGRYFPAG